MNLRLFLKISFLYVFFSDENNKIQNSVKIILICFHLLLFHLNFVKNNKTQLKSYSIVVKQFFPSPFSKKKKKKKKIFSFGFKKKIEKKKKKKKSI